MDRAIVKGQNADRRALFRLARQLDLEPGHCFQVRKNAERLFTALAGLHGLSGDDWRLLEAAALLHDIGHRLGVAGHHKHSRDMILAMDWPGLNARERSVVACVGRYHRKADPKLRHRHFRDLAAEDQRLVHLLAAILRIADGLDRAHRASVCNIRAVVGVNAVILYIAQRWAEPLDIAGARRKAGLFEKAFGRTLEVFVESSQTTNPL